MKHLSPALIAFALAGCNQPPAGGSLVISPENPTSVDDLIADLVEPIKDENDDVVSLRWEWFLHGAREPAHTTDRVPAAVTRKGQVWRVEITPNDGKDDGVVLWAETIVLNSPPVAVVTIAPQDPLSDRDLIAEIMVTDNDESDTTTSRITWMVDGDAIDLPGTTVPASETKRGETWRIEVVPNDGEEDGEIASAEVVIGNVKPVADGVTISPTEAYEQTRLVASATGVDHDEDDLTWTYTWFVEGGEVKSGGDDWLDGGDFSKLDSVMVEAYANDGFEDGNVVSSNEVTILNTPPSLTGARLDPATATENSTIKCLADGPYDVDGDSVSVSFTWTVDRRDPGVTADTIDGTYFDKGQEIVCIATPHDGTEAGAPVSTAAIIVGNTAPELKTAAISPASPKTDDTLSANATGVLDADGDKVTLGTEWFVNRSSVSKGATLAGRAFKKGDRVEVELTPYDGEDFGAAVRSAPVTIGNTAPVIASVTLSPSPAYTTTPMRASTVATDADADSISYTYTWYVDGVKSGSGATLDKSKFVKGQNVFVEVVASDGTDSVTKKSSTIRVQNSAPSTPGTAGLSPTSPKDTDPLVCTTAGSTDADSDSITYQYAWYRNGTSYGTFDSKAKSYALSSTHTATGQRWYCKVRATDGTDTSGWSGNSPTRTILSASKKFVVFATSRFIGSSGSLANRAAANAKCASEARAAGISGSNFKIVYSTPSENARNYVAYKKGDVVYDRTGKRIDGGNLWGTTTIKLPKLQSWTITSTNKSGNYKSCSGSYSPGAWPICQYCSRKFACASSSNDPFNPGSCCWTGTRGIVCMGER